MKITNIKYTLLLMLFLWISSCELTDLDINDDPNNPKAASLNLLLSNALLRGSETFADDINQNLHSFVGIAAEQDIDGFDVDNTTYNLDWQELYYEPLKDAQEIINIAEAQGNNPYYLGVGQLLKAYYFSLMVELWGDIPYSEALKADAEEIIKYPAYDDAAAIYQDIFNLIDAGIVNLGENSVVELTGDPIYNGNVSQWIKMGKSLKLRNLINTRLVQDNSAAIAALINEGDLILSGADDFTFQFSSINNPENENRHPWYVEAYTSSEYGFNYLGHQFMVEMLDFEDPRRPFYLKRQATSILDQTIPSERQTTPCSQISGCVYSYLVLNPNMINRLYTSKGKEFNQSFLAGFFGRDRADPSGAPADGALRTAIGVYPVGGLFDDVAEAAAGNRGTGAGIFPMITSEMVKFYIMEAILTGNYAGSTADVRDMLEEVINEHIDKVYAFGVENDPNGVPAAGDTLDPYINKPLDEATSDYVDLWLARYDNASTDNAKLNAVLKQAWFTNFGNGFEIYNTYRRTGYPNDLQVPLNPTRDFALRLPYAQDDLNFNQSVSQDVRDVAFDLDPIFMFDID
ncbi:SusD/RagB family nutrient-binding outer membrane lipoprotein [Catalinimonas niigatensis]|uniref:SusD/RagB family nutrient-binding outer membrane lipoprotein n=1 Tax=Catalinimonas niigatensis TaxID=1397264 RepID=UPI0026657740|nr:SusD/RagB family nutrient-binding outer membrane lipoprotein [Catalinimonas niigatensis]WPP49266.1 SusD/RagB family nutrient-binding outer membrane lipoprotein [Catalinimonas niigatensis]